MQRHERGDVVGVDGHRSRPLVQARGEGRQDRSSLAMGTARPAAGGGHIALPCGSRGPASPRRPARPRAPAAEPRRTSADDRRMGKRCISPAHPWCSERRGAHTAWRRAHGCGRGKFGLGGGQQPVRGRHHNGSGPFPARSEPGRQQTSLRKCMLFILRLRSARLYFPEPKQKQPSRQRGQYASSFIQFGWFSLELSRNPNPCGTPDRESHAAAKEHSGRGVCLQDNASRRDEAMLVDSA